MKKILVICLSGLLLLNVSGCFNKTEAVQSETSDVQENIKDNDADISLDEDEDDNEDVPKYEDKTYHLFAADRYR